jgi:outer membrane protein
MIRKIFLRPLLGALLFLPLSLVPAAAAENRPPAAIFSLTEICAPALSQAYEIRLSKEDLFIAEKTKEKALSVLVPRFSAFAGTDLFSKEKSVSSTFGGVSFDTMIQPKSMSNWGLRLDQSFTLNGKELIALGMTEDNIRKREFDLRTTTEDYVYQLVSAYYNVLMARTAVAVAEANRDRLQTQVRRAEKKFTIGEVTRPTLLRTQAEHSRSETEVLEAQNTLKVTKFVLSRLTGIESEFDVSDPHVPFDDLIDEGLEPIVATALRQRPEIQSIEMERQIAEDQVRLNRSDYWPTVSIGGRYLNQRQDPTADTINEESLSVGVTLDFTLFDGGLRGAEIEESLARRRQADDGRNLRIRQIRIEVEQAFQMLSTRAGSLGSLQDQFSYAKENYEAVSKLFQHGMADSVDLVDANTLLVNSEKELWKAQFQSQLAALYLHYAAGRLLSFVESLESGIPAKIESNVNGEPDTLGKNQ